MKNNIFKSSLKINVPKIINSSSVYLNKTDLLLLKLGIKKLPENVQAEISEDNNYLNIQLKDSSKENHLLFQFPLKEDDLSALKNRPDYQELMDRYHIYTNDYVDEIKKYAIQERAYLQKKFPHLVFNIKIRTKSPNSYSKKLNSNILGNKDPYINDIIAERILLTEYTGNEERQALKKKYSDNEEMLHQLYLEDEVELREICYEIAKALYDFRINTNFRMKKDVEYNESNSDKDYITKDYIEFPKKNGYQSLHILMEHKDNKDFTYETQIRTLQMEYMSKTSGEIAHSKYKPRVLNDLAPNRVPIYSEVTSFVDDFGNPQIIEIPFDNRFYHFYNSEHTDHTNLNGEHSSPITYEKFRKEQYILENLLGIQFKEIRQKLREIDLQSKKQSVR